MNRRQKDIGIVWVILNVYALAHALFCDPSFCGADRVRTYFTWFSVGMVAATLFLGSLTGWTNVIRKMRALFETWVTMLRHTWINIMYGCF